MLFVAPAALRAINPGTHLSANKTSCPLVSKRTDHNMSWYCIAGRPFASVASQVIPETPPAPAASPFACISCNEGLPALLDKGNCENCGAVYADLGSYVDFVSPKPKNALGQLRSLLLSPPTQSTFETSLVAYLYERGWRRNFRRVGFPGPAAEAELALNHVGRAGNLLDVSCATGVFTRELARRGAFDSIIGLDYSGAMLDEAARRDEDGAFRRVRADVAAMPFRDGAFDAVVSGAAMHCWPKIQDGLVEILRVLKKGKSFFATTFLKGAFLPSATRGATFLQPSSIYTFFDEEQLVWLCRAAGFSKVEVEALNKCALIRCTK